MLSSIDRNVKLYLPKERQLVRSNAVPLRTRTAQPEPVAVWPAASEHIARARAPWRHEWLLPGRVRAGAAQQRAAPASRPPWPARQTSFSARPRYSSCARARCAPSQRRARFLYSWCTVWVRLEGPQRHHGALSSKKSSVADGHGPFNIGSAFSCTRSGPRHTARVTHATMCP